ncbi:hypothetical protein [Acetobacter sp.]|uniref:hypothetical protein n=1 Tax=Acetobacter sp. TaxID=440 RepID=UPI0025C17EF2|nr:hypothetical protein [Acetobacter sp.]MCH4091575.1 hypothetical protein [Acetobacter sp.]
MLSPHLHPVRGYDNSVEKPLLMLHSAIAQSYLSFLSTSAYFDRKSEKALL